jgi:hypothetical protein
MAENPTFQKKEVQVTLHITKGRCLDNLNSINLLGFDTTTTIYSRHLAFLTFALHMPSAQAPPKLHLLHSATSSYMVIQPMEIATTSSALMLVLGSVLMMR